MDSRLEVDGSQVDVGVAVMPAADEQGGCAISFAQHAILQLLALIFASPGCVFCLSSL